MAASSMLVPVYFQLLLQVILSGALPVPVGVPPLEEDPAIVRALPPDALFFVEWFGVGERSPESSNRTVQLAAEPEVRHLLESIERAIVDLARREGGEQGHLAAQVIGFARLVFSRPGALFLADFSPPPRIDARAGIVIELGESRNEANRYLREFESLLLAALSHGNAGNALTPETVEREGVSFRLLPLPPQLPEVAWGFSGDYLLVTIGDETASELAKSLQAKAGLGATESFTALRKSAAVERPTMRSYVDVPGLLKKLAALAGPRVPAVADALGLGGVGRIISESGLEGDGAASRLFVETTGIPSGLLRLFEGKGLASGELASIPRDATLASAFRLDLESVFNEFLTVLGRIEPRARQEFLARDLPRFEEELGLRLVDDLLAPLGDSWRIWNSPGDGGLIVTGLTLSVSVDDVDRLARTLDRIVALAREEAPRPRRGRPARGVSIEQTRFQGEQIHYLVATGEEVPIALSWCLTDKELLVSLFPQMIKAELRRLHAGATPVSPAPSPLRGHEGTVYYSSLDYAEIFRTLYPILHPLAQLGFSELRREGLDLDISVLPSAASILAHLGDEVTLVGRREGGILVERSGTLASADPAVGMLLPISASWLYVGRASAVRARALREEAAAADAVARARPTPPGDPANSDEARLRTLYQALELFRVSTGSYPKKLEDLWSGDAKVGPVLRSEPVDKQGRRFLYFGAVGVGQIIASTAVPERGQRLVAYRGGGVGQLREPDFQRIIAAQKAAQPKAKDGGGDAAGDKDGGADAASDEDAPRARKSA